MSGLLPDDDRLLARIRIVAAVVVLVLFAINAIEDDPDLTLVGMLFGALAVLLGLVTYDARNLRNGQ